MIFITNEAKITQRWTNFPTFSSGFPAPVSPLKGDLPVDVDR